MKEQTSSRTIPIERPAVRWMFQCLSIALVGLLLGAATGCRTPERDFPTGEAAAITANAAVRLNPGDVVQISFPGAPHMMGISERVRIDGRLALPLVDEVVAAGKTPAELQAELSRVYKDQLQINEVVVIVASSSASVFVTGAVGRPGRIPMERPLTVLDAIMEAGGFDPRRANIKKVAVIRQKEGKYDRREMDLRPVLRGEDVTPYRLLPFDIIYVPEKLF